MWGKMSFHRSRKPVIGNPTLANKGADNNVYQAISSDQERDRYYSLRSLSSLSSLPPRTADSSVSARRPNAGHRVASSVYSRDTILIDEPRQRSISLTHDRALSSHTLDSCPATRSPGISPPETPTSEAREPHSRGSSQVSPIDEEPKQEFGFGQTDNSNKFPSHLPVLRKGAGLSQPDGPQMPPYSRAPSSRDSSMTKWGSFSDERATNDFGKPGQVASGAPSFETHISSNAKPTPSYGSSIFGRSKEQFLPKVRTRTSKNDNSLPLAVREPWKGPSGRAPIVAPIQEQPRASTSSRVQTSRSNDRLKDNFGSTSDHAPLGIVPSVVTTITGGETSSKGPEPHVVYNSTHRTWLPEERPLTATSHAPPRVDLPESDLNASLADLKLTISDEPDLPSSRFSATTYEPTETGSSRTASPIGSIDTACLSTVSTENVGTSIMSRKRPVPSSVAPGKKPTRKPTPSQVGGDGTTSKDLPPCPPEQQALGRIEQLEARKDTLVRRRGNINTIIHELTQVIQPSSAAYDMAARDEVKKTVASLNNELAEIKREEHEIGMKLYRAWKKRDEQNNYGGGSGLWVKRVTS